MLIFKNWCNHVITEDADLNSASNQERPRCVTSCPSNLVRQISRYVKNGCDVNWLWFKSRETRGSQWKFYAILSYEAKHSFNSFALLQLAVGLVVYALYCPQTFPSVFFLAWKVAEPTPSLNLSWLANLCDIICWCLFALLLMETNGFALFYWEGRKERHFCFVSLRLCRVFCCSVEIIFFTLLRWQDDINIVEQTASPLFYYSLELFHEICFGLTWIMFPNIHHLSFQWQ